MILLNQKQVFEIFALSPTVQRVDLICGRIFEILSSTESVLKPTCQQ